MSNMFSLNFLTLLFSVHFAFSDDCLSQTPCKCVQHNGVIDLTDVGSIGFPRFHDVLFEANCSNNELYSYNPCFPFSYDTKDIEVKPEHKKCEGAAACIKIPGRSSGNPPQEYAIGLQNTAVFGIDSFGMYINYSVPETTSGKKLKVYLSCNGAVEHKLDMIIPECENKSVIVMNLTSKCCCENGCRSASEESSGISTGSVLLIVFFTVLLAYFVVGVVWNFCNGAHGSELIPNLEFWNELPTLIMEGVIFTCSCFRGRSYGEV